jgi:hypothetical protein
VVDYKANRDLNCRIGLEKMADALDETRVFFYREHHAGPLWDVAKMFAELLRNERLLTWFEKGPFAGISLIAGMLADVRVEPSLENVEGLTDLVWIAREIPVDEKTSSDCEPSRTFMKRYEALALRLGFDTKSRDD